MEMLHIPTSYNDTEPITEYNIGEPKHKSVKYFLPGHCPRCNSTHIQIYGKGSEAKVICLDCNDWAWFEDAIDSCWNGYCND